MTTFAHGYKSLWQNQNNQKGLIPPNGTSPNFLFSKKSFIGHQYLQMRDSNTFVGIEIPILNDGG
jgi:hypothetical protein